MFSIFLFLFPSFGLSSFSAGAACNAVRHPNDRAGQTRGFSCAVHFLLLLLRTVAASNRTDIVSLSRLEVLLLLLLMLMPFATIPFGEKKIFFFFP